MTPQAQESERARLRRELADSRRRLSGEVVDLGHAVNVRERLRDAVRRHPAWWIGGGLIGGVLLANLVRSPRKKPVKGDTDLSRSVKSSLFLGLLGIAGKQILRLSEPALKRYAQREIERWMELRRVGGQDDGTYPRNEDS